MTEKNQEPSLEQRLSSIGNLNHLSGKIDREKRTSERSKLYENLAKILGGGDDKEAKNWYANFKSSPEDAYRHANERLESEASVLEPLYKENKKNIVSHVLTQMKDYLSEAKTKAEAASMLSNYFMGLVDLPELDQITADEYAQSESEAKAGVKWNSTARGSIEKYRPIHESLQARLFASQYLKDLGNGKYGLDEEKIAKQMDDVIVGATLYSNANLIKQDRESKEQQRS